MSEASERETYQRIVAVTSSENLRGLSSPGTDYGEYSIAAEIEIRKLFHNGIYKLQFIK